MSFTDKNALELVDITDALSQKIGLSTLVDNLAETLSSTIVSESHWEGKVEQILEGHSNHVLKFKISFTQKSSTLQYRFVARVHTGPRAESSATGERVTAASLHTRRSAYFPLLVEIPDSPHVVAYRFSDDGRGVDMVEFHELVQRAAADGAVVPGAANTLRKFAKSMSEVYHDLSPELDNVDDHTAETFLDLLQDELPPDYVIEKTAVVVDPHQVIPGLDLPHDSTSLAIKPVSPRPDPEIVNHVTALRLAELLGLEQQDDPHWVSVDVVCRRAIPMGSLHKTLVVLQGEGLEIWGWFNSDLCAERSLVDGAKLRLFVSTAERRIVPAAQALSGLGYDDDCQPSRADILEQLRELHVDGVLRGITARHTDLHAGNLLVDPGGADLTIIDLGDAGPQQLFADVARLELTLLRMLQPSLEVSELEALLDGLENGRIPSEARLQPVYDIVSALREGTLDHISGLGYEEEELAAINALSYVIQILIYQRYELAEMDRAPKVFVRLMQYWCRRLDAAYQGLAVSPPEPRVQPSGSGHSSPDSDRTPPSRPDETLMGLWEFALNYGGSTDRIGPAEDVLMHLREHGKHLADRSLTDLQREFAKHVVGEQDNPFDEPRHVILAGPTSSGKSTLADLFLARAAFRSSWGRRFRGGRGAVYIAPTRALARQKHMELQNAYRGLKFRDSNSLADRILLSTGEMRDDDRRIANGGFQIACMVYEKANILFSRARGFLDRVDCIVVDEFHMLAELQRGPILEVAIGKVVRNGLESDVRRNFTQVVAISTEGSEHEDLRRFMSAVPGDETALVEKPEPAIVISHDKRPVKVEHYLVLPDVRPKKKFREVWIGDFEHTGDRLLSQEALEERKRSILDEPREGSADEAAETNSPDRKRKGKKNKGGRSNKQPQKMEERLLDRLVSRCQAERRFGYRALVFVSSKLYAEKLAEKVRRIFAPTVGDRFSRYVTAIDEDRDSQEDVEQIKLIRSLAQCGVFVHHADLTRPNRTLIERFCDEPPRPGESQVLFATETLKYGVNLAINDVFLGGIKFYRSDRFETDDPDAKELDHCSYHNLLGRAGRLGKIDATRKICCYIVPHHENKNVYKTIVQEYYSTINKIRSCLLVKEEFSEIRKHKKRESRDLPTSLGAAEFSAPFVYAVLNIVRHLNLTAGKQLRNEELPHCQEVEVVEFLEEHTLFAQQQLRLATESGSGDMPVDPANVDQVREWVRFAVKCVIRNCADRDANLKLIEIQDSSVSFPEGAIKITDRGESVIDTGTAIRTIQPLLEFSGLLIDAWQAHCAETRFAHCPAALFTYALLAQEEIYNQYMGKMPEMADNEYEQWDDQDFRNNTETLRAELRRAHESLGIEDANAWTARFIDLADSWWKNRNVKWTAKYPQAARDASIRMYLALLKWVDGHAKKDVITQITQSVKSRTSFYSFRQFKEQVGYRARFLSHILSTGPSDPALDDLTLRRLESRLRRGCRDEGIAMFFVQSSNLDRVQVAKLIEAGLSPDKILDGCQQTPQCGIGARQWRLLWTDLTEHVFKEHRTLGVEWTMGGKIDESDGDYERLRSLARELFGGEVLEDSSIWRRSLQEYDVDSGESAGAAAAIREAFKELDRPLWTPPRDLDGFGAKSPRMRHNESDEVEERKPLVRAGHLPNHPGVRLKFKNMRGGTQEYITSDVQFITVEFSKSGLCRTLGDSEWMTLDERASRSAALEHVVFVCFPWLPHSLRQQPQPELTGVGGVKVTARFMSPAAFVVFLLMLKRQFVKHIEPAYDLLMSSTAGYCRAADLTRIESVAKLKESLLLFFEV